MSAMTAPLREFTPDELADEFDAEEQQRRDLAMTAHPSCDDPAHPGCSRCRDDDGENYLEQSPETGFFPHDA